MRKLLCVAILLGAATFIYARQRPKMVIAAHEITGHWDLKTVRTPQAIGWTDPTGGDYWTGERSHVSMTHPSGRQISFDDVSFEAERERGKLVAIRFYQRNLSHAEMLSRSRNFCDVWNWPATQGRLRRVYPDASCLKTSPTSWVAQTRSITLRVSHDGPDTAKPWCVQLDMNLRKP